ncbi:MAG TPA: DNA-binding protein [Bacilli bacterium]|nr:DNA-binding protein [Bacilli bacterium]
MGKNGFVLWLIWQNQETRQRYHVGNLVHSDGQYSFYYETTGKRRTLNEAMESGYIPHLSFRDIHKTYVSDRLFSPFSRRLPDKRRPDFHTVLRDLGLTLDYTDMDLLRATGGRLATDSYEFVVPISVFEDSFHFDFYIAGWRYYDGDNIESHLNKGLKVRFELEPENEKDPEAVIVLRDNKGHKLGYIPSFYSGFMFDVLKRNDWFKAQIEEINVHAKPQLKAKVSVVGQFNYHNLTTDSENLQMLHLNV